MPDAPLMMAFRFEAAGKTVEGTMKCPDADKSTHLLMMVDSMIKQVAEQLPEVCAATIVKIEAEIVTPSDQGVARAAQNK